MSDQEITNNSDQPIALAQPETFFTRFGYGGITILVAAALFVWSFNLTHMKVAVSPGMGIAPITKSLTLKDMYQEMHEAQKTFTRITCVATLTFPVLSVFLYAGLLWLIGIRIIYKLLYSLFALAGIFSMIPGMAYLYYVVWGAPPASEIPVEVARGFGAYLFTLSFVAILCGVIMQHLHYSEKAKVKQPNS